MNLLCTQGGRVKEDLASRELLAASRRHGISAGTGLEVNWCHVVVSCVARVVSDEAACYMQVTMTLRFIPTV
jgi:hypothetical protein